MGMDAYLPWVMAVLGALGFFITWNRIVVGVTQAIGVIKTNTSKMVTDETEKITKQFSIEIIEMTKALNRLSEKFEEDQRTQDNRFGETAMSIRQYVAIVEKEMHQIEIWGRDNYILKSDFLLAVSRIELAIKEMHGEMKNDLKDLSYKVEHKMPD